MMLFGISARTSLQNLSSWTLGEQIIRERFAKLFVIPQAMVTLKSFDEFVLISTFDKFLIYLIYQGTGPERAWFSQSGMHGFVLGGVRDLWSNNYIKCFILGESRVVWVAVDE